MNRLQQKYQKKIVPVLKKEFNFANNLAVPRLEKIVVNVGIGDIARDKTKKAKAIAVITAICGQKPKLMAAKKAVSEFRIRQGNIVGLKTTLRRSRMYVFLDKLISIALPRIRDFQGVKSSSFDGQANYTLGLTEQTIFPEVEYDMIEWVRGMEISIVTNSKDVKVVKKLLELMGMPFEKLQIKNKK